MTTFFQEPCDSVKLSIEPVKIGRSFRSELTKQPYEQVPDLEISMKERTFSVQSELPLLYEDKLMLQISHLSRELDWLEYLEKYTRYIDALVKNNLNSVGIRNELLAHSLSDDACKEKNKKEALFIKSLLE